MVRATIEDAARRKKSEREAGKKGALNIFFQREKSAPGSREDGLSAYFKDKPAHPTAAATPRSGHQP